MLFKRFSALALVSRLGASVQEQGTSNITISFFPTSETTCSPNTTTALTLTTSSIPSGYVCFNLTETFTSNSSTGSRPLWRSRNMNPPSPPGIDYLLQNRLAYNPSTNYTRVHYTQVNQTGEIKPGADGRWVFYTYPFLDCAQVGGDNFRMEEYPWFETSCQTGVAGECRDVLKSVRSFAIGPAFPYNRGHGQCEVWAELGGAAILEKRTEVMAIVGFAMLALFVL